MLPVFEEALQDIPSYAITKRTSHDVEVSRMADKPGDFFKEMWNELTKPPKWMKDVKKPGAAKSDAQKKDDKQDGKKAEAGASKPPMWSLFGKKPEATPPKQDTKKRQPPPWWSWSTSDGVPEKAVKRKKESEANTDTAQGSATETVTRGSKSSKKKGKSSKKSGSPNPLTPHEGLDDFGSEQPSPLNEIDSMIRSHGFAPTVLNQYGVTATKVEPFGPVLRLRTPQGLIALKKTFLPPKHVQFLYDATKYLSDNNFTYFSPFLLTQKGAPYAMVGGDTYYATQWIRGQEADFRSAQQLAFAARTIAQMHHTSRGFEPRGYAPSGIFDMVDRFQDRRNELQHWKRLAQNKRRPDGVDVLYLKLVDAYTEQADKALAILKKPEVRAHLLYEEDDPCLCHLDVTPYNMVWTTNHQICLIDLDFCTYGPRTLDLAHLMRRALQRQEWDESVAWQTLMNYQTVSPLAPVEHQILYGLLMFPHRFWRIAYQHYELGHNPHHLGYFQLAEGEEEKRQKFLAQFGKTVNRKFY